MRAGTLHNRIEIQARNAVEDAVGGERGEWATVLTTDAYINPLSGREFLVAHGMQADTTHEITMRYWAPLTAKHRIKYGDRIFNIDQVLNDDERNTSMTLRCIEGLNEG